jgi:hypothetical protein
VSVAFIGSAGVGRYGHRRNLAALRKPGSSTEAEENLEAKDKEGSDSRRQAGGLLGDGAIGDSSDHYAQAESAAINAGGLQRSSSDKQHWHPNAAEGPKAKGEEPAGKGRPRVDTNARVSNPE